MRRGQINLTFLWFANVKFPWISYLTALFHDFITIHHREWGWYRSFGQFSTLWSHPLLSWLIQIAREYSKLKNWALLRWYLYSGTMTWVWFVFQDVRMNSWIVCRRVALRNVSWNAIEHGLSVVTVSTLIAFNFKLTYWFSLSMSSGLHWRLSRVR